jgi:hypothetical protein
VAAGATYTPIATTTLGSTTTELTFSSISGAYTDLVLVCAIKPSDTINYPSILAQFNSDSGSNYSETRLQGNGSTAASARRSNVAYNYLLDNGLSQVSIDTVSTVISHIQNYSNTTTYKTVLSRSGTPDGYVEGLVTLWRSTSAITSIKVFVAGGGMASGSTFTLYGIAAA